MVDKNLMQVYVRRFVIILIASSLLVWAGSEAFFRLQDYNVDRNAMVIELTIPAGTAELVANGEAPPSLPDTMVFVQGDTLVVHNEDSVTHELGPLLVPAGTSASLPMDNAENLALSCSFQPSNYLGMEVKEPTTWKTRLLAISFAAPPTAVMAFLYSLALSPIGKKKEEAEPE